MPTPSPTPEEELLLLATRLEPNAPEAARLEALVQGPLDWPALQAKAAVLRGEGLIHHHLERHPGAPPEARAAFAQGYQRTALKNLRIYGALRRVLLALRAEGIPVLLLKGAFLAKWLYADLALRPMGDLDLLCRKGDETRLWAVLERQGAAVVPEDEVTALEARGIEHVSHAPGLMLGSICRLEVHFHLLARHVPDDAGLLASLWAAAREEDWDGLPVLGLSWEHQLLHLASHLHTHALKGEVFLYWFADLHELLRRHGAALDWDGCLSLAQELGLSQPCREVFELLEEPWPGKEAPAGRLSASRVLAQAAAPRAAGGHALARYRQRLRALPHAGGLGHQAVFLFRQVFPPWQRMRARHPEAGPLALSCRYLVDPLIRVGRLLKGG